MEAAEASGLQEMVTLMNDNLGVIDLEKEFSKFKYLVRMTQTTQEEEPEPDIAGSIKDL